MITIHTVDTGQAERLRQVRALLYQYGEERNFDAALGNFTAELDNLPGQYALPSGTLLLATLDKNPAGCIAFRALDHKICEMKRLSVAPKFRGQGIARWLIRQLLQRARTLGYSLMRLDSHPHMHAAIHLYRQFDFIEIEAYNHNPTPGIRFFERRL